MSACAVPRQGAGHDLTAARRIVAVRLDGLGDLLMTTPALRALATSRPGTRLTLVTSPAAEPAARLLPFVDEVVVYDAPWVKASPRRKDPQPDLRFIERLVALRADLAVIFTVHTQSPLPAAMATYLAGIPRRLAHCRENPYQLLTDRVAEPEVQGPMRHEVVRQLDLVEGAGFLADGTHLSLRVPPDPARRIRTILSGLGLEPVRSGLPSRPWAVLHPGATAPSRRYPPERLAEAAASLARDGWGIVVAGGLEDVEAGALIADRSGGRTLAGRLTLGELAALFAAAPVAITCNSGPMHVAAAVGTPVVALYALTNLQHTPWGVPSRVLSRPVPCAGCLKSVCPLGTNACLAPVEPAAIAAAAVGLVHSAARGVQASAREATTRPQRPVSQDGTPTPHAEVTR